MKLREKEIHPLGERKKAEKNELLGLLEVDTFDGKVRVQWDPDAAVTPLGQLSFFIEFLKVGHRFNPWVEESPLFYQSNNAPQKVDVLGSFLLSILSGHSRYAHIATLISDRVNSKLLGMNKVVSDDSARRALRRMDEEEGVEWMQQHLYKSYEPLLKTPWILDTDVTVKPLYGHQEGAVVGYNSHKPGRPSHTYHTYLIANLRLILDVEVQAGNQTHSSHSLPGLMEILRKLPEDCRPEFIRGDCDWGIDNVMNSLEEEKYKYLFKLKKSKNVKALIYKHHSRGNWVFFKDGWEAKEDRLSLFGWEKSRRVVIVRKKQSHKNSLIALECQQDGQQQFAFIDGPEDFKLYEYSVLVTNLDDEIVSVIQHYRDRADCENIFDELKNQWGWGGFTTKDIKSCRLIARIIGLIYNWWSLFVRLACPNNHREAITSRPLLLTSVGRLIQSGRQKQMVVTSSHASANKIRKTYEYIAGFFKQLKAIAPQLTPDECWSQILARAMRAYDIVINTNSIKKLPLPT